MNILITGSTGFIGSKVMEQANLKGWRCLGHVRDLCSKTDAGSQWRANIDADTDWQHALIGVDCVVHCAARVHHTKESAHDAATRYHSVNTEGTLNLARQAANAGVKRFVFMSSIKVNGTLSESRAPFTGSMTIKPTDPYGLSKYEAEQGLKLIAQETGLEVVVIRSPLVYGEGVKANFLSLMRWVQKGVPLPLGAIHNQRSLIFLDNLVDFILCCCEHKKAGGHTFLVSDQQDVSTTQLLKNISYAMNKPYRMLPIPMTWLNVAASMIGKGHLGKLLCGNLQVDSSHATIVLGWTPPFSFEQGIEKTVKAFLNKRADVSQS